MIFLLENNDNIVSDRWNPTYFEGDAVEELNASQHEKKLLQIHNQSVDKFKTALFESDTFNINNDNTLQQYLSKYHEDHHYINPTERQELYDRYISRIKIYED